MARARTGNPRYRTVLFDFDHTLFDSDASELAAFNTTMLSFGVADPMQFFESYRGINATLWQSVEAGRMRPEEVGVTRFEQLATLAGIDADPLDMATTYIREMGNNGELYPGALELLDRLAGQATLAMVTNAIGTVQRPRIERLGLADYFAAVVISSEVGVSKPHPGIFEAAFAELGSPEPHSTLMVGDSLTSDIQGGVNAGLDTCWYNPHRKASGAEPAYTYEISHISGLEPIVAGDGSHQL